MITLRIQMPFSQALKLNRALLAAVALFETTIKASEALRAMPLWPAFLTARADALDKENAAHGEVLCTFGLAIVEQLESHATNGVPV